MQLMRSVQNNFLATALICNKYYWTYHDKNEPRTSRLSGFSWVMETLNTPGESHRMFRMNATLFYSLHDLLVSTYGLKSSIHISSMESLAFFLVVGGHLWSNTAVPNNSSILE